MEKIGLNELREMFLSFYEAKGHYRRKSYSLIPESDKSLLIINSGMAPLKPYFAGLETPPSKRMTTCQKCIRTGDIDNVGYTDRHGTFFEMMGSFSFGDYFKKESLEWGWEFVIDYLKMPEDKLWASVYEEDDEAYDIWKNIIGLPEERIVKLGKEDNFWEIGTGPCGPCSEIYYDRGEEHGCGRENCKPGCDCDRYLEFWNHVFTQFNKDDEGNYTELQHKNIDTGMGLERIALIMQDVDSIYAVDTLQSIIDEICRVSGKKYTKGKSKEDVSIRIITDHLRSISFMIADGILPGNEGRGYVLRRLLRRAIRHGHILGIDGMFLADLSKHVISVSADAYPELKEKADYMHKMITAEEEKFSLTIKQGEEIIKDYIAEMEREGNKILSGEKVFKLYDTYGFPLELTQEILKEHGYKTDVEDFNRHMNQQKQQAREARKGDDEEAWKDKDLKLNIDTASIFTGYNNLEDEGIVLEIYKENLPVDSLKTEEVGRILLDRTPFYAEGGGQSYDIGVIYCDNCSLEVLEVKRQDNGILHKVIVRKGILNKKDKVKSLVAGPRRNSTAQNHTATHLLHKALREVLGDHVEQAGSSVDPKGLRFDFSHFQAMTAEEIERVEAIVNAQISLFPEVKTEEMPIDEALNEGVMALFDEKYEDIVRVVSVGNFSKELCGGTHVKNAGQIGAFKIVSEAGVASGVRRIEAVTGLGVLNALKDAEKLVNETSLKLKVKPEYLLQRAEGLTKEFKALKQEILSLKKDNLEGNLQSFLDSAKTIGKARFISHIFENSSIKELREVSDQLKAGNNDLVMVLAAPEETKLSLIVSVSDGLLDQGYHAGRLIKEIAPIIGGSGGGKADMAQAGGKDSSKLQEAFNKAEELLTKI